MKPQHTSIADKLHALLLPAYYLSSHLALSLYPSPQAGFMLKFLEQLKLAAANPTNPLNGKLDLDNMGAAGHSRGGKIAALHFAGKCVCDFGGGGGGDRGA